MTNLLIKYLQVIQFPMGIAMGVAFTLGIFWYGFTLNKYRCNWLTRTLLYSAATASALYLIMLLVELPLFISNFSMKTYTALAPHFDIIYAVTNWVYTILVICWIVSGMAFLMDGIRQKNASAAPPTNLSDETSGATT